MKCFVVFGSGVTSGELNKCSVIERVLYAGFFICFVPFIACETEWNSELTYENIYKNTKYVHIQEPRQAINISNVKPKTLIYFHNKDTSDNVLVESDQTAEINDNDNQLLVGFSYDPYGISVTDKEFNDGVRSYQPNRGKRGVANLYNMIHCATGCEPLSYKGYGCYCGFLGSGRSTDGIDRCCKQHDKCYENLYCPFYTVYFQPYYWKCYHREPLCALENHDTRHQLINGCAGRLCECDRQLAMCLRRYACPRRRAICRSSPIRLLQNVLMLR